MRWPWPLFDEGKRYDAQRDRWLNEQGYQVLRFTGQQIEYQTPLAILDQTIFALKDRNRTSDSKLQEPSPPGPLSHKNGRGGDSTSVMAQHQNQPVDRNDLEPQIAQLVKSSRWFHVSRADGGHCHHRHSDSPCPRRYARGASSIHKPPRLAGPSPKSMPYSMKRWMSIYRSR